MDGSGELRRTSAVSLAVRCAVAQAHLIPRVGFALFFSIFEMTRRAAVQARQATQSLIRQKRYGLDASEGKHRHTPRVIHAVTLVTGGAVAGLAYELACRPWDAARKAVHTDRVVSTERHSIPTILLHKLRDEGWASFVRAPLQHVHDTSSSPMHRKLQAVARTLARVGPWGIGFLVWETLS